MWCAERGWVLVLLSLSGCSFLNRLDTCEAPKNTEAQVNAVTSGDQETTAGQSVARLASGGYVVVWASRTGTAGAEQTEVRATLLSKEGKPVTPCGSAQGDIAVSVDLDAEIAQPVVAAGLTQDAPIYIAWTQQNPGEPLKKIQLRLFTQDLCKWSNADPQTVTVSEVGDDNAYPTLAVRSDGQQALLAWLSASSSAITTKLRIRPVGPAPSSAGWLYDNGCDLTPTSCVVDTDTPLGQPVLTSTSLGYVLAWSGPRDDGAFGWQVRMRAINTNGTLGLDNTIGKHQFGQSDRLFLSLSANAESIAIAGAIENGSNMNEAERGVYVERLIYKQIDPVDPTTIAVIPIGSDPNLASTRVDAPGAGIPHRPSVHLFASNQAVVSWSSEVAAGANELHGALLDPAVTLMFNGLSCDISEFAWPGVARSKSDLSSSLVGDGFTVLDVFHSSQAAEGGTDSLGTSVHALELDFKPLSPLLK